MRPTETRLDNQRVILISGTSRGIGNQLALHYVKKNLHVVGCSRTPINIDSPNYHHFSLDISDEKAVREMFSYIRKSYGRLDYLINNAAINPAISPAILTPMATVRKTMEINFLGTFLLSREAAKLMSKNSFGRIINFSSMAAYHHVAGEATYTASKAAVTAFSRVFAKEVFPMGITCNTLAPSAIKTDLSDAIDPKALAEVLARNAIPHLGTFEDVIHSIDYLIDEKSSAITGQTLYLGGV